MIENKAANVISLSTLKVACKDCTLFQLCLPLGVSEADLQLLDRIIKKRRAVKPGEHLFRGGDAFTSIYAVKSGSFKTFAFAADGAEQVIGLHLPGELFGMDAISSGAHCCNAVALERSAVCEIPFDRLEELAARVPSLMRQMVRIMSKEIMRDKRAMQITKAGAEGRLAGFLLSVAERYHERGFARDEYHLSMSRVDIGNYLGLADETVSRLFTRFKEDGLLMVERRHIRLIDVPRLRAIASGAMERASRRGREEAAGAKLLAWDSDYSIGVEAIDEQHRRLFDISNRFYDAWRVQAGRDALCRIFDELLEYTRYHFAEEERLMQQISYPGLPQHRRSHEELVDLVGRFRRQLESGTPGVETEALEFVKTWLNIHVLEDDRDIGEHLLRSREQVPAR
jgi:CRP/FNR family transcriptional regulator